MTAAAQIRTAPTHLTAGDGNAAAGTLAGEPGLLMRGVARRAGPVLALLETRAWPHAELGTLTAFLRNAVLRRASDEEALFYPHAMTPPFAELSAEHVRLHTLTARLEHVRAEPCAAHELRALVGDLLMTLQRHLLDEQAVLAALPDSPADVPGAVALAAG